MFSRRSSMVDVGLCCKYASAASLLFLIALYYLIFLHLEIRIFIELLLHFASWCNVRCHFKFCIDKLWIWTLIDYDPCKTSTKKFCFLISQIRLRWNKSRQSHFWKFRRFKQLCQLFLMSSKKKEKKL